MGTGHVTLPGGLEVVVESRASNNPIVIPGPEPSTPTTVWCFQCQEYIQYVPSVEEQHTATHVTVEEPPTSFSPFSLMDCMLLSHFSFDDFIAIAFLDLARDLDIQI